MCGVCHTVNGEGGAVGPDLSTVGGRFTIRDIAESIVHPSAVVSDQYAFSSVTKKDGTQFFGRLLGDENGTVTLAANPFDQSQHEQIAKADVAKMERSPISPMPGALINRLNPDELKDLLAWLTNAK